jgi:hypothetical protein
MKPDARRQLPPEVIALIRDRIDSLEVLEVLLLVRRDRTRRWDAASISAASRIRGDNAERALRTLATHGFVEERRGGFRWSADGALDAASEELARVYAEEPLELIREMNAQAIERAREWAARRLEQTSPNKGTRE